MSDDNGWHKPVKRSRPTLLRAAKCVQKIFLENLQSTRPHMERRARRRDEAELRAEQAVGLPPPRREDGESALTTTRKSFLSVAGSVEVDKDRLDEICNELMGDAEKKNGGPYRAKGPLSEERQDELAKEFVMSKEKLEPERGWTYYFPIAALPLPGVGIILMSFFNTAISMINILLPKAYKIPKIKPPLRRAEQEIEAALRKESQAYKLLKSGVITSGRAQYILVTQIEYVEHAKELLLSGTITNEMAQIELVEKIGTSSDAREVMSSERELKENVAALLREKAELPSLPPKPKD